MKPVDVEVQVSIFRLHRPPLAETEDFVGVVAVFPYPEQLGGLLPIHGQKLIYKQKKNK